MESIRKFQDVLKKLFQDEISAPDFGIYRVLNSKRNQIEKFIQEDPAKKVIKIKARNTGKKYPFILGEKQGRNVAVDWREYNDNRTEEDFKKEKKFINKEIELLLTPQIVYVNGQSVLTPKNYEIRYIEQEFKR